MPLIKSKSKEAFGKNIATEIRAGKPPKQAAAIAYSVQRSAKKMAKGGDPRLSVSRGEKLPLHKARGLLRKVAKNLIAQQVQT